MDTCSSTDVETQTPQESSSQEFSDSNWRTIRKRKRRTKKSPRPDEGENPARKRANNLAQEKEVLRNYGNRSKIQCFRCQGFGHTQWTCEKDPKCLKCGQEHLSYTCKKKRDTPCKCANCGQDHPANYRGCPEFRKAQKFPMEKARESSKLSPDSLQEAVSSLGEDDIKKIVNFIAKILSDRLKGRS